MVETKRISLSDWQQDVEAVALTGLSPAHALLLQAVLRHWERGAAAYAEWRALVTLEDLDAESYRLVPWLYCTLQESGVTDALTARLRGIFRRTWYSNQLALRSLAATVGALRAAGVETRALGGGLSILSYHDTPGLYPLDGIDLLTRRADHDAAIAIVRDVGWTPIEETRDGWILKHSEAGYLALHRDIVHGLTPDARARANTWIWRGARALQVNEQEIALASPEAHLLFVADYGVRGGALSPVRWLAEVGALLTSSTTIDWNGLLEQARLRHAAPHMAAVLQATEAFVPDALPQGIVEALLTPPFISHHEPALRSNIRPRSLFEAVRQACGNLWRRHWR